MDDPALLTTQVYKSEAYQIYLRLHTFGLNYYVFTKNYEEVRSILIKAQSTEAFYELWTGEKQQELLLVTRELIRRFHNFLASAKTLVDHSRSLIDDHYQDTSFYNEYQHEKFCCYFFDRLRLPVTGTKKQQTTGQFIQPLEIARRHCVWPVRGRS